MLINLSEVMSVKDKVKHIEVPFEKEAIELDGMKYQISKKSMVDLKIANLGDRKVSIKADAEICLLIPCSRCLEDVEVSFDIHFDKKADFRQTEDDKVDDINEMSYITDFDLDVDLLIYGEILLDFPLKVLCKEDCKGICNSCGKNLNKGSCECDLQPKDPRMAAIQDIFKNFVQADE